MDARYRYAILLVGILPSLGANYRTQNFIVTAPTAPLAREIADAAERYRRELAREWLERELPPWHDPCPILAHVNPRLGAGGYTSFMFRNRTPFGWEMEIQGSRQRILDSVLPHEVTHTIFATHFGGPLPRWADEGACTTVEHQQERVKQEKWLINFLKTKRGIPFNHMFAMTEYPGDIMPLYAQGYSVSRYLIAQGGKPKFVRFVGDGLQTGNWAAAVRENYGFSSLGNLQLTWVEWVKQGSPNDVNVMVANDDSAVLPPMLAQAESGQRAGIRGAKPLIDHQATQLAILSSTNAQTDALSRANWYVRRSDGEKLDSQHSTRTGGDTNASMDLSRQSNESIRVSPEQRGWRSALLREEVRGPQGKSTQVR